MAVRDAQPASIMCAYNRLNGVSACSNAELLDATLRGRWGFGGYVMTDRSALHDLAPSIKAGVDWELAHQTPVHYALDPQPDRPDNRASEGITAALAAGSITVGDIDQMLRRRYIQMFTFGHFESNFDALFEASPDFLSHGVMAREIAQQAIVLLKNDNNFLPLSAPNLRSVALIGASWYAGIAKLPPRRRRQHSLQRAATRPYGHAAAGAGERAAIARLPSDRHVRERGRHREAGRHRRGRRAREGVGRGHRDGRRRPLRNVRFADAALPMVPPADIDFCAWNELTPGMYTLTAPQRAPDRSGSVDAALTADPEWRGRWWSS